MPAALTIHLNGQPRTFADLTSPADLPNLIEALGLKPDRIAVEHNGQIVYRSTWTQAQITEGDRLEIVHFVGGGTNAAPENQTAENARAINSSTPF
jgi:sulfur carrier protein